MKYHQHRYGSLFEPHPALQEVNRMVWGLP